MSDAAQGYWVIVCSLVLAAVLMMVPVSRDLSWWRPEWILLVLVYWAIALPHRIGLATCLIIGFFVDVMEGAAIGQNMLTLSVVVMLSRLMYQRLRVFTALQQASVVFVLVGIHQLLGQWLQNAQGVGAASFGFLLPAVSSALLWPLLMPTLRSIRRSYRVL